MRSLCDYQEVGDEVSGYEGSGEKGDAVLTAVVRAGAW